MSFSLSLEYILIHTQPFEIQSLLKGKLQVNGKKKKLTFRQHEDMQEIQNISVVRLGVHRASIGRIPTIDNTAT